MKHLLPRFIRRGLRFLASYPSIGRRMASLFGLFEVTLLETMWTLGRRTRLDYFGDLMPLFLRVYGSRVIPLDRSLDAVPTISPTEEILSIVRRVPNLALSYCYCRARHKNCNNDLWTCIQVGSGRSLEELASAVPTKSATLAEVEDVIMRSHEAGLVHQLITAPTRDFFYVICNCCACCCVTLRSAITYGYKNTALASNFIAVQDRELCDACGVCVKRCHFGARQIMDNRLAFDSDRCVGCGLCVTKCPQSAISMTRR